MVIVNALHQSLAAVVSEARNALGRDKRPDQVVTVFTEKNGYDIRLVKSTADGDVSVIKQAKAASADEVCKVITTEIFPRGNKGDELVFLEEENDLNDRPGFRRRWVLIDPISMKPANIGGRTVTSHYNPI